MILQVNELTSLFPENKGAVKDNIIIRSIMTDTRKKGKQSLFIPIVGESFDAHQFMGKAIEQGATAALWQRDKNLPKLVPTDFPVFFVEDTIKALQELSAYYLKKIDPVVIGVTGSNGKTTTKDMLASVLSTTYVTHKTQGNFNNHIGLPLTILSMDTKTEALVLEMGMDRKGEISVLSNLAEPDHAIITNIGESHIENLGSREAIAEAKLEIKEGLRGRCAMDGDEPLLEKALQEEDSISCGFQDTCTYSAQIDSLKDDHSSFTVNGRSFKLPMAGRHNVKNATYIIAIADQLNVADEMIQEGFYQLQMSGMRYEKHKGKNGALIINDAYNASPTSMKAIIEVISDLTSKTKKVLVLGDMYELGQHSRALHRGVAEAIDSRITTVFTIGEDSEEIKKALDEKNGPAAVYHYTDKQELTEHVQSILTEETVVLLKASRGMKLEELLDDLTE